MTYIYTGKIHWVSTLDEGLSGTIKRKITVVIDTGKSNYLTMLIFNENIEKFLGPVEIGDKVTGEFSIKSHQWNNKWVTNCYCLSMSKVERKKSQQRTGWQYEGHWKHQAYSKWFTGCSTANDIKKRYRELSKKHHPDMPGGNTRTFQEINAEYETLTK